MTNSDGLECEIRLFSEEELAKKKARKPRKKPLTHCPHCGMSLDSKPIAAKQNSQGENITDKSVAAKYRIDFIKVGEKQVPVRIPLTA